MRWPSVWLTAFSLLLVAGCGGQEKRAQPPRLDAATASRLAAAAERIADEVGVDGCRAREDVSALQAEASSLPKAFREPLLASLRDVARRIRCESSPPTTNEEDEDEHGHGKKDGKHKGKHGNG
jgi:hypothetical protein